MLIGRTRRRSVLQLAGAAALGAWLPLRPEEASAAPLSDGDVDRLARGEVVRMPLDLDLPQGDYFGGVSYAAIHAPPALVTDVLADPSDYQAILPMTMESRVLWQRGRDTGVFFRQGA